jgi:hypothetical protein
LTRITFHRRDPSLPPVKRASSSRVPEREMTAAEANVAVMDGIMAVLVGFLALLSLVSSAFLPATLSMAVVALLWGGAAFAMTRGHWLRWWVQGPLLVASVFALLYALALTGQ